MPPSEFILSASAAVSVIEAAAGEPAKRPTFTIDAYNGGLLRVGGFMRPMVVDLAGLRAGKVTILKDHDPAKIVGQGEATITGSNITVTGTVTGDLEDKNDPACQVVMHARNGFVWPASVGVTVERIEWVEAAGKVRVNGHAFQGPIGIVRAGRLGEVSFVGVGADETASAKIAARAATSSKGDMDMNFEAWVKGLGFDPATLSPEQKSMLQAKYDAEQKAADSEKRTKETPEPPTAGSVDEIIAQAEAEQLRTVGIRELVAKYATVPGANLPEIKAVGEKAIAGNWAIRDTELALLRVRARAPEVMNRRSQPTDQVLAAAMLMACNVKDEVIAKDLDFGPDVAQAAYKRRNMGLHAMFAAALLAEGVHAPHGGEDLWRAVVGQQLKAGWSTVDLPGILGTVGNKLLLNSFTAVEATYDKIAQQADFNNFLTYTNYQLDQTGGFEEVGATGEIKSGKLVESTATNKLATRGVMLTLTRQAIINDDMNALQQLYAMQGRKARVAVEKALYGKVMEASDVFYTSGRGNKLTSSALSVTTLGTAEACLLQMVDGDGDPVYAMPKYLLVPPGLLPTARALYVSEFIQLVTSASTGQGTANPYKGRFEVVSSPYMALSAMTGYSATGWYMLADPNVLPAVQVAFLQGRRQPTVETADAVFSMLGWQIRCYFDFGVAQVDYRGAVSCDA
jgi:hypothetical protein